MMNDNWYIVLELEYDPNPVEDWTIIEKRIEEKARFWSQRMNDPIKGPTYRRYHDLLPEIRKAMSDEQERKRLIREACAAKYAELDKTLRQIGRKGWITDKEISNIAARHKTEPESVKTRAGKLGIPIRTSDSSEHQHLYDEYYKKKPKGAIRFENMGRLLDAFQVQNLYEFLFKETDVKDAQSLDCGRLLAKARELRQRHNKHDGISGTVQKLCEQCEHIFKTPESKAEYDEYLEYGRRKAILDTVRTVAEISGELPAENAEFAIGRLTAQFKDPDLAQKVLDAFCKVENIRMLAPVSGKSDSDGSSKVCRCGTVNDVSDGRRFCRNCGLELVMMCPKCRTVNDVSIKVCKCGFRYDSLDKALSYCRLAEREMAMADFAAAGSLLEDAEKHWPGHPQIQALKSRNAELRNRVGPLAEAMWKAADEGRYHEAGKRLEAIRKIFPEFQGGDLESEITSAVNQARILMSRASSAGSEREAAEFGAEAYMICKDYPGARELAAKHPPVTPSGLKVVADGRARINQVSWSTEGASSSLFYSVVRKRNAAPEHIRDGELIGRVNGSSVIDDRLAPGVCYYYAVFAERGDIVSRPAVSGPVINRFEAADVTVAAGDTKLYLSWAAPPDGASAIVYRISDGGKEECVFQGKETQCTDSGLVNERTYRYRICLVYHDGGKTHVTPGVYAEGIPGRMPKPIERIRVKLLPDGLYEATWDNPEKCEVRLYASDRRPPFQFGDILSLEKLQSAMTRLLLLGASGNSAKFANPEGRPLFVAAVAVKAESAVFGDVSRAATGELVKVKSVNEINGRICIRINPPEQATGFVVLYRFDAWPADIGDVKAVRKYITMKQYVEDRTLIVGSAERKDYYISVFAEFAADGGKEYSEGAEILFRNSPKVAIFYSVKTSRSIFGSPKILVELEVGTDEIMLPEIEVVCKEGGVPLYRESGKRIGTIPAKPIRRFEEFEFSWSGEWRRDLYVKLFLKDDSLQSRYQLQLKKRSSFKIS